MALCRKVHLTMPTFLWAVITSKLPRRNHFYDGKVDTLEIDAVDDFTTHLVQRKAEKWKCNLERMKIFESKCLRPTGESFISIEQLSLPQINSLLRDANDMQDLRMIKEIFLQCSKLQKLPSLNTVLCTLAFLSQKGDKDMIINITEVCGSINPDMLETNSHFKHFLAGAIWVKGNTKEAVSLIENVYRENVYLRRRIRLMLKYLIYDTVSNKSEANLYEIVRFSEKLAADYSDYYPMLLVWKNCLLSEWFSDQCIALDLLKKHTGLCSAVTDLLSYVVTTALHKGQSDVVYRLLEAFLKEKKSTQSLRVLITMFDYKIREGDLHSCSKIIKWSLENDIVLPAIHQKKFVNLLCKTIGEPPHVISRKKETPKPFNLKF